MRNVFIASGSAGLLFVIGASAIAYAQQKPALPDNYPRKAIRIVVASAAGGGTDFAARLIGTSLSERWGIPVVIDNRTGASGAIAVDVVAKANPDGYTLLMTPKSAIIAVALISKVAYDTRRDLVPISMISAQPYVLVTTASLPSNSVKELIGYAKSKPNALSYASAGVGADGHLTMELFKSMAGVSMEHVSFNGTGPGMIALLGGHIQLLFGTTLSVSPHAKSGRIKMLAVTSLKRTPLLPDVATVSESGLSGFESIGWTGFLGTAGTPSAIVSALDREISQILKLSIVQDKFLAGGGETAHVSPAAFREIIAKEFDKTARLVKELNLGQ